MNLLALRVADILFEEGGRFLVPEDEGGRTRVEEALRDHLTGKDLDPARVTVDDFRVLSQDAAWTDLLERLIPPDTHGRVAARFEKLVFS